MYSQRRLFTYLLTLLVALSLAVLSCSDDDDDDDHHDDHGWSYDGDTGPEYWGDLDEEYRTCADGMEQSPINIESGHAAAKSIATLDVHYADAVPTAVNNGHTIQINYPEGSYIMLDGKQYNLLQFHFHAFSEHTINGNYYPMEMHLVHQSADGGLAVVGLMIVEGAQNAALAAIFDHLPVDVDAIYEHTTAMNLAGVLPANHQVYRYDGSLTTPPCTEGVKWNVMVSPIELSSGQINAFTALYDHNYRPIQPLNGREVTLDPAEPNWSYDGQTGPDHWGDLDEDWHTCGDGMAQSPINIISSDAVQQDLPDIVFDYQDATGTVINNGHTIQVDYPAGSSITIDGTQYNLLQFHFHASSEHQIDGSYSPMEMHLVHQNQVTGALAVVGLMIEAGAENSDLAEIFSNLPEHEGASYEVNSNINLTGVLPADLRTYRYGGSLTTPPCSEGVHWNLIAAPIEFSAAQINAFTALYNHNFRPIQDLNGRTITFDSN